MACVSVGTVSAADALKDLLEISSQVRSAVVFAPDGDVEASTFEDGAELARLAQQLLDAAAGVRESGGAVNQLEVATGEGSVFVVRDGARIIAATTSADPTVGLVFYDLKSCLRDADEKPARKRATTAKRKSDGS
jgi:predicted regulator of Ras-like GTPase activity (Roadblock/LC7/MglB family)